MQNGSSFTAMDTDLANNGNLALMGMILPIFRCPSDPGSPVIPADITINTDFNPPFTPMFGAGGSYPGAKTSYDFITSAGSETDLCNCWPLGKLPIGQAPYLFGQNSNCPVARVTHGMSNTFMLAETNSLVRKGGSAPAWGYRARGMAGIDPKLGINRWMPFQFGTLWNGNHAASMHQGGCYFAMGDGTVRFLHEDTNKGILYRMSTINESELVELE